MENQQSGLDLLNQREAAKMLGYIYPRSLTDFTGLEVITRNGRRYFTRRSLEARILAEVERQKNPSASDICQEASQTH